VGFFTYVLMTNCLQLCCLCASIFAP